MISKKGIHIPFDIGCIKKIIAHPKLNETDEIYNTILSEIKNKKLDCPVLVSNLYKESW